MVFYSNLIEMHLLPGVIYTDCPFLPTTVSAAGLLAVYYPITAVSTMSAGNLTPVRVLQVHVCPL